MAEVSGTLSEVLANGPDTTKRIRVESESASLAPVDDVADASNVPLIGLSAEVGVFPVSAFQVGDLVFVARHRQGKKEIEAGKVKVTGRTLAEDGSVRYDVRYLLWARSIRQVHQDFLSSEDFATNDNEMCKALSVRDTEPAGQEQEKWVRRSRRYAGNDQLGRPDVKDLIARLERDDPNDSSLVVLRLKNWLEADTNSQVLTRVFELVGHSKVVQALYVQNMEQGMDDERLKLLSKSLAQNPRIWALNVGENFKISKKGWETFAEDLKKTGVTHIYAGSESTVSGELKVKMRDAVRDNRSKHDLHMSRENLPVIAQIGQMWWNPRNSKAVQSYKLESSHPMCDFKAGDRVVLKDPAMAAQPMPWVYGTVIGMVGGTQFAVQVCSANGRLEQKTFDLLDPKVSVSTKSELVFGERNGRSWPALHFAEPHLLVYLTAADNGGDLLPSIEYMQSPVLPFFLDEEELERSRNACWRDSMRAAYQLVYGK